MKLFKRKSEREIKIPRLKVDDEVCPDCGTPLEGWQSCFKCGWKKEEEESPKEDN